MPTKDTKAPKQSDIFVSTVIPADIYATTVDEYIKKIVDILAKHYANYEIIVVDNGMPMEQVQKIINLLDTTPCIRVLRLSRNHSRDTAIFSGLEASIGDYVCVLSPILDPPEVITRMIDINRSGTDIVQGVSNTPVDGKLLARYGRTLFYWYNRRFLATDIPLNATYLVSFNRRAVNALTNTVSNHRYVRQLSRHIGFKLAAFTYTPLQNPRHDRTLRTSALEAVEIVTSFSSHPLRFVTWLGIIAGITNLLYAAYVVIVNVFRGDVAEGWTTLSLQSAVMFFFVFMILIILAEYIGRILSDNRQTPPYHIMEELNSTVAIAQENRRNITK